MEFEASLVTALLEASASAVGVGMVLGGFIAGVIGQRTKMSRDELERFGLKAGYGLAAFALAVRLTDVAATI
jgi:hypothetical protein